MQINDTKTWLSVLLLATSAAAASSASSTYGSSLSSFLGETLSSETTVTQVSARPTTTQLPLQQHPLMQAPKPNGLKLEKPNFIIFMPDQLRFDSVGFTGNKIIQTPNLGRFAQMGTHFTNCFTQASSQRLAEALEPNLFRSLKDFGGYHIAYLGPRGDLFAVNTTEESVNEYGFLENATLPDFAGEPQHFVMEAMDTSNFTAANPPTISNPDPDRNSVWNRLYYGGLRNSTEALDYDEKMIRGALDWLECPPQHKPWVLFLPLIFPHPPFEVEEPWFSMYNRSEMPLPADATKKTGHEAEFAEQIREQFNTYRATPEIWQEVKAVYYGMISRVDNLFGRIMNKTIEKGHWNNTVTMFFTDHGEFLGDWGLVEKWPSAVSENLVHEPLIIGGAGLPENAAYDEMTEMVDLVPTMLQLSSTGEHYAHYGLSLVDAIHAAGRNETISHKQYSFTEGGFLLSEEPLLEQGPYPYDIKGALQHDNTALVGKSVSVRDKEYTYVYRLYEADELYRRDDTEEYNNLASLPDYAHVRARMREVVLKWMVETADTMPWYMDARVPQVVLDSPQKQFSDRVPDCENCNSKGTCTEDIVTSSQSYVVVSETAGVWDSFVTSDLKSLWTA